MEDHTTDALIARVENDILDNITATSVPYNIEQTLSLATDIMREECVPFFIGLYEEYYLVEETVSLISGQAAYDIPEEATAGKLRDAVLVRTSDGKSVNLTYLNYSQIPHTTAAGSSGTPTAYFYKANKIGLYPTPDTTEYTLKLTYYRRPKALVTTSGDYARSIASYSAGSATLSSTAPASWTTSLLYDVQRATPFFDYTSENATASTVSGTSFVFTTAPTDSPSVGSYITRAGYSAIPDLPAEAHPWLAQLVSAEILEGRGDFEGASRLLQKAEQRRERLIRLFTPRTDGDAKILVNRHSLMGVSRAGYYFRGY